MSLERVSTCTPSTTIKYDPSRYKVVFFSSAPIGIPFLQALAQDAKFEVIGVVTMPDAPAWRGMKVQENPIKTEAKKIGLPPDDIQTPQSLQLTSKKFSGQARLFHDWLLDKEPDYLVVIAYGKIIPQAILDMPLVAPINVHGSLLPKYRGASPLQSVFIDKESHTGVTIMIMNKNVDEGDILSKKEFPIPLSRTAKDLIEKMKEVGVSLLLKSLRAYGKGHIDATPQDHTKATFCNKIEKSDGVIEPFSDHLEGIYNKRRAYILWPKTSFIHQGKNIIIEQITLDTTSYIAQRNNPLLTEHNELNPAVSSLLVRPEGKKTMSRDDYLRGYVK